MKLTSTNQDIKPPLDPLLIQMGQERERIDSSVQDKLLELHGLLIRNPLPYNQQA